MSGESTEVRIKLVADDQASSAVERLRSGMGDVAKGTLLSQLAMKDLGGASAFLAGPLGIALESVNLLKEGTRQAYEWMHKLGEAAIEAAEQANKQNKMIAGTLSLLDGGKHSMGQLRDYAEGVGEELGEMGLRAGKTREEMVGAYEDIVERGQIGSEEALELAGDMAMVGKVVRGGMESLSSGFSMIEMGVVRARNPLVQLIAATHTLKGNARDVAAEMQKMTPEKQMELARQAVAKQADAMRASGAGGQASLGAVGKTMDGVKEMFLEAMGQPMLHRLLPPLNELRKWMIDHSEEIIEYGHRIGEVVGKFIGGAVDVVRGLWDGLSQNFAMLKGEFKEIFGSWSDAWHSAHADSMDIRSEFRILGDNLALVFKGIMQSVKWMVDQAMDANDRLHFRAAGTTRTNVEGSALKNVSEETTGSADHSMAVFDKAAAKYRKLAEETGYDMQAVDAYIAAQRQHADQMQRMSSMAGAQLQQGQYEDFSKYVDNAIQQNNEGAQQFAFSLIAGSDAAMKALLSGSIHITGGMDALMQAIDEKAPELAAKLHKLGDVIKGEGGIPKGGAGGIHMSGGQTFHIKQDFRDQDPDRVLFAFRRDLAKHTVARVRSRLADPFGF